MPQVNTLQPLTNSPPHEPRKPRKQHSVTLDNTNTIKTMYNTKRPIFEFFTMIRRIVAIKASVATALLKKYRVAPVQIYV